ncbi:MAG: hypothetical protein ACI8VZ_001755, partial [Candidatus Paceibacteria bacterium]
NNFEAFTSNHIAQDHTQLALLDIDKRADRYEKNKFKDLFIPSTTGTAETTFEDDDN